MRDCCLSHARLQVVIDTNTNSNVLVYFFDIYLLRNKSTDRLQSEEYRLEQQKMNLMQGKKEHILVEADNLTTNPVFLENADEVK